MTLVLMNFFDGHAQDTACPFLLKETGPPKMADDIDPRQRQHKNPLKLLMAMCKKLQCQDSSYRHLHVTIARVLYTVF